MLPYVTLIGLPAALQLTASRRTTGMGLLVVGLIYVVFIGMRFEVGPDWSNYGRQLLNNRYLAFRDIWSLSEPGFAFIRWLSDKSGIGQVGMNTICAAFFCFGVFSLASRTASPWVAVVVASSYLVIALGMSGIRQSIAAGLIFWQVGRWFQSGRIEKVGVIALAATFHFSALFMLAFLAFEARVGRRARIAGFAVVAVAVFGLLVVRPDNADLYVDRYVGDQAVQASGAIYHALLNAIPGGVYLLFRRQWNERLGPSALLVAMSLASIAMLPLLAVSTVGVSRLSMYLTASSMIITASAPYVLLQPQHRRLGIAAILVVQILVMVVWFTAGNHGDSFIPYRNALLEPFRTGPAT